MSKKIIYTLAIVEYASSIAVAFSSALLVIMVIVGIVLKAWEPMIVVSIIYTACVIVMVSVYAYAVHKEVFEDVLDIVYEIASEKDED